MNAVECAGIHKSFGAVVALDGVDLAVPAGGLTALLGPSGCGKSTLLRIIAGFERPDAGTVTVGGEEVAGPGLHRPPERRRAGIVPQEQALFPHMTVAENVAYGLDRGEKRAARVDAMLDLCGLAGLGGRMPHELSGGQQQRVAVARALAPEPSVVLLDEPFANLDATLRGDLRAEIAAILRTSGQTALLVTHDQDEALSMADQVAVMRQGRIVQYGAPDLVYQRPADLWVADFVGGANVLTGRLVGAGWAECALGRVEVLADGAAGSEPASGDVQVVVRPEQIVLSTGAGTGPRGVVEHVDYYGHDAMVRVSLEGGRTVLVRTRGDVLPQWGAEVGVGCRGPAVCFTVGGRPPAGPPGPMAGDRSTR